jgi:hypothetical protein
LAAGNSSANPHRKISREEEEEEEEEEGRRAHDLVMRAAARGEQRESHSRISQARMTMMMT